MAKAPVAGHSKTRLVPPLSPEDAAGLAEAFLLDTLAIVAQVPGVDAYIAVAPATVDAAGLVALIAPDVAQVPQQGDSLGERLDHVLTDRLAAGYRQVVAINADGPTLPSSSVAAAFEALDDADVDVVLGPTADGGYYLIGQRAPHPRLVRDVEMSTPRVLADTMAIAADLGLRVVLLDEWYDVDEPADLARLRTELAADPTLAPHTRRLLFEDDR